MMTWTVLQSDIKKLGINVFAIFLVLASLIFFSWEANKISQPIDIVYHTPILLDGPNLFFYALRTIFRMIIAMLCSIIFSIIYAFLASNSKKLEQALIPMLDILQSVPILGYISFTVGGFIALAPNTVWGFELVAIFAIFTSQAWNITFSLYQSFKNIPQELIDVADSYNFSRWKKFWAIDIPYATPGMIWNMIMSMSGGWFFVVAAECINYNGQTIMLPGIGSYISCALAQQNWHALIVAVVTMTIIILIFNQVLFASLVRWSIRFRYELTASENILDSSILDNSWIFSQIGILLGRVYKKFVNLPSYLPINSVNIAPLKIKYLNTLLDGLWCGLLGVIFLISAKYVCYFAFQHLSPQDFIYTFWLTCITFLRVIVLLILASIIFLPLGIYISSKPSLSSFAEPIIQILASFPANLLFPLMVIYIHKYDLNPDIWLSPLMIIASQWYILFNVIAGMRQIPNDLKEVIYAFQIQGLLKYKKIILPAIAPYYITGLITAAGGSWNASILAEAVTWGNSTIYAHGIGGYITRMTQSNDFAHIVLGVSMMCFFVVMCNKIFWSKIYNYTTMKFSY